ncbi:MAG: hypothetical protein IT437_04355 [Phycisphaerales bacterium]|nr:hypothetical protein [Phycisphaerales bacterium]
MFLSGAAAAQPAFPPGSLMWIRADDLRGLSGEPAAALLGDGVSRAITALIGDAGTGRTMGSLAAEATRQGRPWSLCIVEYAAEQGAASRRIERLSAYFRVDAPADGGAFASALPRPPGEKETFLVAPGREAIGYDRAEPWQRIEWGRWGGELRVGFGAGSLARSLTGADPAAGDWSPCEAALVPGGRSVVTVWLDLNALRRAMPDEFTETPVGRVLAACRVSSGRGLLLSVAHSAAADTQRPALYAASLTWSSRGEPLDVAHRIDLTETAWPADLPPAPAGSGWVMAIRSGWGDWIEALLHAWVYSGSDRQQVGRAARRTSWMRDRGVALAGLIRASGPYVVLSGGEHGPEARCALSGGADRFRGSAAGVFNFLGPTIRPDPDRHLWRWTLDHSALEWGDESGNLIVRPVVVDPAPAFSAH